MKIITVNKCCCCFDLKYGFYTWAIMSLVLRITTIFMILYSDYLPVNTPEARGQLRAMVPMLGYFIATTITLFIAVNGIIQERSLLIYPYIVVMIFEIMVALTVYFILGVAVHWIYFVMVPFVAAASIYLLVCLFSLYKQIQVSEKDNLQSKSKDVTVA